jgi:hypothetical protein
MGFAASIRCFVKMGYSIGLIPMAPCVPPDPDLHERSLRGYLGDINVNLVRRRGGYIPAASEEFLRLVREELGASLSQKN